MTREEEAINYFEFKKKELKDFRKIYPSHDTIGYRATTKEIRFYDMAISALENKGEWIPVSERLPEESLNSVIGWDAYRERCVFVQYIDGDFQITGRAESFNIVAWQPLPAPYKAESEDKE